MGVLLSLNEYCFATICTPVLPCHVTDLKFRGCCQHRAGLLKSAVMRICEYKTLVKKYAYLPVSIFADQSVVKHYRFTPVETPNSTPA